MWRLIYMSQNKAWLKFLITGNPKDYLNYKNKIDAIINTFME